MSSENCFFLMQKLKCLSRVGYLSFIHKCEPDRSSYILAWLFEKAIDLVDGIIRLHQANLDECSQALIRILFETHLKYIHFANLMVSTSEEDASLFVFETIILMREKSALEQDKVISDANFTKQLGNLEQLHEKYSSDLKNIKKHGFLLDNVENIARKYNKILEYQIMYRSFSRNVHTNDFVEYLQKNGRLKTDDYIETRNTTAFNFVLRIFIEMMTHMNHIFSLGMSKELQKIQEEYKRLQSKGSESDESPQI